MFVFFCRCVRFGLVFSAFVPPVEVPVTLGCLGQLSLVITQITNSFFYLPDTEFIFFSKIFGFSSIICTPRNCLCGLATCWCQVLPLSSGLMVNLVILGWVFSYSQPGNRHVCSQPMAPLWPDQVRRFGGYIGVLSSDC